jgi:hypothetical protein
MIARVLAGVTIGLLSVGCVTVEGGFKYEYQGRVLRADGKTPAKNVSVRMARADPAATQPVVIDLTDKASKASLKYQDRTIKRKTDSTGTYVGILETFHGWKYHEVFGNHMGPTHPPLPPALDEVILYVDEKGSKPAGYRMKVPPENQATATSGVRKIHLPDLILPPKPTTKPTTQPTTQP